MIDVMALESESYSNWDEFVLAHPDGNPFLASTMIEVLRRHRFTLPIALVSRDEKSGKILGGVVSTVSVEKPGILSQLSTRAIIHGGPLLPEGTQRQKVLETLMNAHDRLARRRALYSEVWLQGPLRQTDDWQSVGYEWHTHLNYSIDLRAGEQPVWDGFASSRRRNVRQSERVGVLVRVAETPSEFDSFCDVLEENHRCLGIPLYPRAFFWSLWDVLVSRGLLTCFVAWKGGQLIGGRLILHYGPRMYDWYASSLREFRSANADSALVWQILRWGIEKGYEIFDFGGAGDPDVEYGPREFKKLFGGEEMNVGRLRRTYSPLRTSIAERGFSFYQRLGRLRQRATRRSVCRRGRTEKWEGTA